MDLDQFIVVDGACAVGAVRVFIPTKVLGIVAHFLNLFLYLPGKVLCVLNSYICFIYAGLYPSLSDPARYVITGALALVPDVPLELNRRQHFSNMSHNNWS